MTNPMEYLISLFGFSTALSVVAGLAIYRKEGPKEDAVYVEATNYVLDSISDSDKTGKIELHSGRNIRDQLSVEQAEEMHKEREMRSWSNRN